MNPLSLKKKNSLSQIEEKFQFFESYWNTRKVELLESYCKKTSTLWVILRRGSKKKSSILWVIYKEFNSLSNFLKKSSILWVFFWHKVQFYESYFLIKWSNSLRHLKEKGCNSLRIWKKGLNSLTHIKNSILWDMKKSILWVIFKKFDSLSHTKQKKFNSWSHIWRKVQFFESKKSVLWVKIKRVQFFESRFCLKNSILWVIFSRRFHSSNQIFFKKKLFASFFEKSSILWVIILWKEFNFLSIFSTKNFNFWVVFLKKSGRFFESYSKKSSTLWKVFKIFWVILKKGSVLWVVFLSYIDEKSSFVWIVFFFSKQSSILSINLKISSILWVKFKKKEGSSLWAVFSRRFNSPSYLKRRVQFFASCSKKKDSILCVVFKEQGFHSLRHIQNKGSILCVILEKQGHFFESWKKWVQILESIWKNLCVTLKKFISLSRVKK